jgi:glycerol-3-phosphate dehydrogenase
LRNDFVVGVSAKNVKTGEKVRFEGKVVVDASGFLAVVRRKLPREMGIENEISMRGCGSLLPRNKTA